MEQVRNGFVAVAMLMLTEIAIGGKAVTEQVVVAAADSSCRASRVGNAAHATDGAGALAHTQGGSGSKADVKRLTEYMYLHAEVREESGLREAIPGSRSRTRAN